MAEAALLMGRCCPSCRPGIPPRMLLQDVRLLICLTSHLDRGVSRTSRLGCWQRCLRNCVHATQAASVALLLVVLLRSSESVGVKAAVLMLLLLIAVSGMLTTQHFALLAGMPMGDQRTAAVQSPAQQTRQRPGSQPQQAPSDSRQRSVQGAFTLSEPPRRVVCAAWACYSAAWPMRKYADLPRLGIALQVSRAEKG